MVTFGIIILIVGTIFFYYARIRANQKKFFMFKKLEVLGAVLLIFGMYITLPRLNEILSDKYLAQGLTTVGTVISIVLGMDIVYITFKLCNLLGKKENCQ